MFYVDLEFWRGTKFGPMTIQALDSGGAPLNLTGFQVVAKTDYFDLKPAITDPVNGIITIVLQAADTAFIELGKYRWDMLLTNLAGEITGPFVGGAVRAYQPDSNA